MNAHDQAHEHGHEHSHTAVLDSASAHIDLEGHLHEQAAAVAMEVRPHADAAISFVALTDVMGRIAAEIEDAGGIVGHVKVAARQDSISAHASIVQAGQNPSGSGDVDCSFGEASEIQIAAIALLVDLDMLIGICKRACTAL